MKKLLTSEKFQAWLRIAKHAREAMTKGQRRFLVSSVCLHLLVVILMTWSWSSTEAVKTYAIPNSIEARILSAEEIERLPHKQKERHREKQLELDKAKKKRQQELAKKKELERKKKELERKKQRDKQKAAAAKKEQERKVAEAKKLQIQKENARKKAEQERLKKKKLATAEQQRKRDEQTRKEVDRLKQLAQQREQKLQEQRLAERLKGIKDLKANVNADQPVFDLDEKSRYLSIIKSRIESRWHKPPNSGGAYLVLRIQLFPSGELSSVKILESSGNSALDESALRAVKAVTRFEVPSDSAFFEKYFRSFQLGFRPEN